MNDMKIGELLNLDETIAGELFEGKEYPWDVLDGIKDFILKIGPTLPEEIYEKRGENVFVARSAKIFSSAYIGGPCIIGENTEVRQCAFIRGTAIVGNNCVVGNSTELKNVILFNNVQVPHYNYVGDSVLGFKAHMGAGAVTSNVKADRTNVTVMYDGSRIETGRRKFGAILGDNVEVGCNSVLNPGTVVGRRASIYPLSMVRGFVPADHIFKKADDVVLRKQV